MNGTWVKILVGGVFRTFSDLHRKMCDRRLCNVAGLNQISENVYFPDVLAS